MKHSVAIAVICVAMNLLGGLAYQTEKVENYTYSYSWDTSVYVLYFTIETSSHNCAVSPKPTGDFVVKFNSADAIGAGAFSNCTDLTSLVIPQRTSRVAQDAFYGCSSLTNITFEADSKLNSFNPLAVKECNALQAIDVANNSYTNIDGVLYTSDLGTLVKFPPASHITELTLPATITTIEGSAFKNATNLVHVTVPQGLTKIGEAAFSGCSSLSDIELPTGIKTIPDSCFENCSSITSVVHRFSNLSIGDSAFNGCSSLRDFDMTNCTRVCQFAFANTGLDNVYTRASTFEEGAFSNCTHISIAVIGHGDIPRSMFYNCASLKSIAQFDGEQNYYIGDRAFYGCRNLKTLSFKDGLTGIGFAAMSGCSSLESMTIPNYGMITNYDELHFSRIFGSEQYDGSYLVQPRYNQRIGAYNYCYTTNYYVPLSLRSVKLTQIESIGLSAFEGCYTLREIELPNTLTQIGYRAFWDCWGLEKISVPASVTAISTGNFGDRYSTYPGMPFGGNSSIRAVEVPGNIPMLSMVFASYEHITNVVLSAETTEITQGLCEGCVGLETITIPASVELVGDNAFKDCTSLGSVVYLGDVPSLGGNNIYEGTPTDLTSYVIKGSKGWDGDPNSDELPVAWPTSISGSRAIDYYIDPALQVVTPIISPSSCTYSNPYLDVSIACDDNDAAIYYTTDGTEPSTRSMEYSGTFSVYRTAVVKAIAVKRGYYPSKVATVVLQKADALSEAGNLYSAAFDNDASAPWVEDDEMSHDGVSSIRSGTIDKNGVTEMVTSIKKSGTISFWWRTKCEEPDIEDGNDGYYDFATFLVDGTEVARVAGEDSGWRFVKYDIPTGGKHELKWRYQKDGLTTFSPDCVWIDQIQWEPADGSGHTYSTPVSVPFAWLREYGYDESNFEMAANQKTGKLGANNSELSVWCDYLQGTNPTNLNDKFVVSIEMKDGHPELDWHPYLHEPDDMRTYRVRGKADLLDHKWIWPADASKHRFFTISVSPYDSTVGTDVPGRVRNCE